MCNHFWNETPKFLLPGFTHHPNAAWPSLSSPVMPAEPAAGCATAGTVGHLCLSSGHGCCPDSPRYPPHPGTLGSLPSPLLSPCCFWVAACPPSFRCPDWGGLGKAQYSFGHPFEYMYLVIYDGTFQAFREGERMEEWCPYSGSVVRSALPVPWTEEPGRSEEHTSELQSR